MASFRIACCLVLISCYLLTYSQASKGSIDICKLKPEPGRCLAYFPSWAYDYECQKCISFIYGGCGGNANRFETKEECEKTCPGRCRD